MLSHLPNVSQNSLELEFEEIETKNLRRMELDKDVPSSDLAFRYDALEPIEIIHDQIYYHYISGITLHQKRLPFECVVCGGMGITITKQTNIHYSPWSDATSPKVMFIVKCFLCVLDNFLLTIPAFRFIDDLFKLQQKSQS